MHVIQRAYIYTHTYIQTLARVYAPHAAEQELNYDAAVKDTRGLTQCGYTPYT